MYEVSPSLAYATKGDTVLGGSAGGGGVQHALWYMDQFARTIAVVALASNDRAASEKLAGLLGTSPYYFMTNYPPDAAVLRGYGSLQQRLNAAADPSSDAYKQLVALLAAPPPAGAN